MILNALMTSSAHDDNKKNGRSSVWLTGKPVSGDKKVLVWQRCQLFLWMV